MHFAVIYAPGPNWTDKVPEQAEQTNGHIAHQQRQLKEKALVLGGPFTDRPGAGWG